MYLQAHLQVEYSSIPIFSSPGPGQANQNGLLNMGLVRYDDCTEGALWERRGGMRQIS